MDKMTTLASLFAVALPPEWLPDSCSIEILFNCGMAHV